MLQKKSQNWLALFLCMFLAAASHSSEWTILDELKPATDEDLAVESYRYGLVALVDERYEDATRFFEESLKHDSEFSNALLGLAEVAYQTGNQNEAKARLDEAAKMSPDNPYVWRSMGRAKYLNGEYPEAERALQRAIELDPDYAATYVNLGDLYAMASNNMVGAEQAYRRALKLDEQHAGAHYALGNVLARQGKPEEALIEYKAAASLQPDNPMPLVMTGQLFQAEKRYDKAISAMDAALAIDEGLTIALIGKGDAYAGQQNPLQARQLYKMAIVQDPASDEANYKLGMIEQQQGNVKEAIVYYKAAVASNDRLVAAYNNLAWISAELGEDLENAVTWAKRAVELTPESPMVLDTLGWVYYRSGKTDKAIEIFRSAIKLNPEIASIHYHLGLALKKAGDNVGALAAIEGALLLDQEFDGNLDAKMQVGELRTLSEL